MSERTFSATRWAAITPSDTATIEPFPVSIRANVGGDIACVGSDGVAFTFTVTAGVTEPLQPIKVLATGTTATGIAGLYN